MKRLFNMVLSQGRCPPSIRVLGLVIIPYMVLSQGRCPPTTRKRCIVYTFSGLVSDLLQFA